MVHLDFFLRQSMIPVADMQSVTKITGIYCEKICRLLPVQAHRLVQRCQAILMPHLVVARVVVMLS